MKGREVGVGIFSFLLDGKSGFFTVIDPPAGPRMVDSLSSEEDPLLPLPIFRLTFIEPTVSLMEEAIPGS